MPFVSGYLTVREGPSGDRPDNTLPEAPPGWDTFPKPVPPPGVWPPPTVSNPIVPIPPDASTKPPPGTIWPPVGNPPGIDNILPTPRPPSPGTPTPPIATPPPVPTHPIASNTYWMLVYTPGHGWKYVAVDPSLSIDNSLPVQQPPTVTPHK